MKQHPACAQEIKSFQIAPLIERSVGTLYPSTPGLDEQGERSHATTADAAKKIVSKQGHQRNLQALPMRCNAGGGSFDEQEEMQDRRRRAGLANVCGRC
jgi:hypothetical protein